MAFLGIKVWGVYSSMHGIVWWIDDVGMNESLIRWSIYVHKVSSIPCMCWKQFSPSPIMADEHTEIVHTVFLACGSQSFYWHDAWLSTTSGHNSQYSTSSYGRARRGNRPSLMSYQAVRWRWSNDELDSNGKKHNHGEKRKNVTTILKKAMFQPRYVHSVKWPYGSYLAVHI